MSVEDEIDGITVQRKKTSAQHRGVVSSRFVVYVQLITLIPSVLIGRCEQWGYGGMLQSGFLGTLFGPAALAVFWSAVLFPVTSYVVSRREGPRGDWSSMTTPCSVGMNCVQILAILPLVQ